MLYEVITPYVNEDDLAGINSSWNFLEKMYLGSNKDSLNWAELDHGLTDEDAVITSYSIHYTKLYE